MNEPQLRASRDGGVFPYQPLDDDQPHGVWLRNLDFTEESAGLKRVQVFNEKLCGLFVLGHCRDDHEEPRLEPGDGSGA